VLIGAIHDTPTVVFPLLAIAPVGLPGTPVVVALVVAATEIPNTVSDVMVML
jgi:hypothetical protein